ncbi:MAG: ribonuclease P protein component [Planctomycetes bacterium]|nr:ribonuclease P protein component [Planctomycetota bacterium]
MKKYTFRKKEHLLKERDFERLLKHAERLGDKLMTIYLLPNELPHSRLGIIVAKKRVRKSTRRNYIKRLVREAYRLNKNLLPKKHDIIINITQTEGFSLKDIEESLLKLTNEKTNN